MAAIVVMPTPFGNVLPALALMFIGLGLVVRDSVALSWGRWCRGWHWLPRLAWC